ncbi:hypothetical protein QAD02_015039 [Eretmocerus hayati]|uniref:Uncharacterized protein n=1 Tax=Eretmocerus hayati TaxID=131215 RepID=A0ACC2P7K5_9HYME|nr:hypothetical protein QAD02_015039 [Eretmocerus hayati]
MGQDERLENCTCLLAVYNYSLPLYNGRNLRVQVLVSGLLVLAASIASLHLVQPVSAKPKKACKYWCKSDDDGDAKYFCCPNGDKDKDKDKDPGLLHWALNELFELHEGYPWLVSNSWMQYLLPVIFKRSQPSFTTTPETTSDPGWEEGEDASSPTAVTGGCPKIRPSCPRGSSWLKPPASCGEDGDCSSGEKCCFDVCLDHKTCKPAVSPDADR